MQTILTFLFALAVASPVLVPIAWRADQLARRLMAKDHTTQEVRSRD